MARKIRFPLKMKDGADVRTLEELREHFDLESVLGYFTDGKLQTWFEDRYYDEKAQKTAELSADMPDLNAKLCDIIGVEYSAEADDTDFEALQRRNEKLRVLREVTDNQEILNNVDAVAFDQDELFDILDDAPDVIYLYGDKFSIPYAKSGIIYIGVNNPEVLLEKSAKEYKENEIVFQNVRNDDLLTDEPEISVFNWTIQDAEDLILQGEYQEAFPIIKQLAENGDARAMYHMARYYNDGYNTVQIDRSTRNEWLKKAYPYREPLSVSMYSEIFQVDFGEDDYEIWIDIKQKAQESLYQLAQSGDVIAKCSFSNKFSKFFEGGVERIEKLNVYPARNGYALAQYRLGRAYEESMLFEGGNNNIAIKWYLMAAEQGHAPSQYKIWKLLEEKDHDLAEKWLHKAVDQSHPDALYELADQYRYSGDLKYDDDLEDEAEKDYAIAFEIYQKAAAHGSRDAMRELSDMYRGGNGVEKSVIKAQEWKNKYDNTPYIIEDGI